MSDELTPSSDLILYQTEDGQTRIQCRFDHETVWLSQALMAELFQKDVRTINEHLVNIFQEGELSPEATIREFRIVASDGKTYEAHRQAEEQYDRFAARRRATLEAQGEADLIGQLEAQVRKLPKPRKPKRDPK